jgi:hypothetical protein
VKAFYTDQSILPLPPGHRFSLLLLLAFLAGCALFPHPPAQPTAPPPPPAAAPPPAPPAPPPPPPAPALPLSRLICTVQEARRVSFADLGVPAGSRPVDLALGKERIWVLFEPALLVAVPRAAQEQGPVAVAEYGAVEETEMIPGPRPDAWRSVAADPWDGTLWLASPSGLWRRRPGRRPEPVAVTDGSQLPTGPPVRKPRKGAKRPPAAPPVPLPVGGFQSVVAGRGAVWVAPACGDHAVWKLDSQGRRLATALPVPAEPCAAADLQSDWSGDLLARLPAEGGAVFRLGFDGSWQPAGDALAVPVPPPDGGPLRAWFFWGTEPLALGGPADDPRLYRRVDGKVTAFHEDCGAGNALVRVAGDRRGWAALTREGLLVGEHRRAEPAAH